MTLSPALIGRLLAGASVGAAPSTIAVRAPFTGEVLVDLPVSGPAEVVAEAAAAPAPKASTAHSSAELLEEITGTASDAPLCMTCGIKMRPAGSCYVCEGCGSTSGCS